MKGMPSIWWEPGWEDADPEKDELDEMPDEYEIEFDPELPFN